MKNTTSFSLSLRSFRDYSGILALVLCGLSWVAAASKPREAASMQLPAFGAVASVGSKNGNVRVELGYGKLTGDPGVYMYDKNGTSLAEFSVSEEGVPSLMFRNRKGQAEVWLTFVGLNQEEPQLLFMTNNDKEARVVARLGSKMNDKAAATGTIELKSGAGEDVFSK